jgi:hypothetical protein
MPSIRATAKQARAEIQEHLARHLKNKDSPAEAYILYDDIQQAWSGRDTIQLVLAPAVLLPAEVDMIRERLLRFLSILVWLGAHEFLNDFRTNLLHADGRLKYNDSVLPFKDAEVPPIGGFVIRQRFLNEQYIFIPVKRL